MPIYRCEYELSGRLVLEGAEHIVELQTRAGMQISIRNGEIGNDGQAKSLAATVIGEASSLETAQNTLRTSLAEFLDLLSFVTHSAFRIERAIRLVEWNEGTGRRKFRTFHSIGPESETTAELTPEFFETALLFDATTNDAFIRTALKYFRYGLLDEQPEDQFVRFWLALEIVAENIKPVERASIFCQECGGPLCCATCNAMQTRVPMAKQAIEFVIKKAAQDQATEVSKRLFLARNGLMHGRSIESVERETHRTMAELVDELATISWKALISCMPRPSGGRTLVFGHRDWAFANRTLVASVFGEIEHKGPGPHPDPSKLPTTTLTAQFMTTDPMVE